MEGATKTEKNARKKSDLTEGVSPPKYHLLKKVIRPLNQINGFFWGPQKVGFFASSRFDPNFSHRTTSYAVASPTERKFETIMIILIVFVQLPVPYASIT